jgi:hypothetical protein
MFNIARNCTEMERIRNADTRREMVSFLIKPKTEENREKYIEHLQRMKGDLVSQQSMTYRVCEKNRYGKTEDITEQQKRSEQASA